MKKREICKLIIKQGNCVGISCYGAIGTINEGTRCPMGKEGKSCVGSDKAELWLSKHPEKIKAPKGGTGECVVPKKPPIYSINITDNRPILASQYAINIPLTIYPISIPIPENISIVSVWLDKDDRWATITLPIAKDTINAYDITHWTYLPPLAKE